MNLVHKHISNIHEKIKKYKAPLKLFLTDRKKIALKMRMLAQELSICKQTLEAITLDRNRLALELQQMTERFDVGIYRLDFNRFRYRNSIPHDQTDEFINEWFSLFEKSDNTKNVLNADELAEKWQYMFNNNDYDKLIDSMFNTLPIRIAHHAHPDFFKPLATYYMACFFTTCRDFIKATPFVKQIEFDAPPDGTDFLPYELLQATRNTRWHQEQAIKRGIPNVVIFSLMKSASAYLSNKLSQILDAPVMRLSVGESVYSLPVPRWIRQIADGGAITHEHLDAASQHLITLQQAGIKDIWIQIRDPRDAAYSLIMSKYSTGSLQPTNDPEKLHTRFIMGTTLLAMWIDGWIQASKSTSHSLKINFITYNDVTNHFNDIVVKILKDRMPVNLITNLIQRCDKDQSTQRANFRSGTGNEWKDCFDNTVQKQAWNGISADVRELLKLEE